MVSPKHPPVTAEHRTLDGNAIPVACDVFTGVLHMHKALALAPTATHAMKQATLEVISGLGAE